MAEPPVPDLESLFAGFDEEEGTVVDMSLDESPQVPAYPALAQFGPFEILGRLARGGMAEVYLGREPSTTGQPRHLVLKRILPEREDDVEFGRMFQEEADIATRLYHPNVCHVYEAGEIEGTTFMALEWVYGVALRKLLRRAGADRPLPPRIGAHIIARVAAALDYVHHAMGVNGRPLGIIHRDVSPHNIMVSWTGKVKLLDFGIARTSTDQRSEEGVVKGKFSYLAPEQARGKQLDTRCDIFTLGICLYETLTCSPLYHRGGMMPTLEAIVREDVPSARSVLPHLAPELDAIVQRALQKHPDDRFPKAGHMRDALDTWLSKTGGPVSDEEVARYLGLVFGPEDREPLPPQSSQLTGSFQSLTGSLPQSGSYGPFGTDPRKMEPVETKVGRPTRPADRPPAMPGPPPPPLAGLAAPPALTPPKADTGWPPWWVLLVGAIVLVALGIGIAFLLNG